MDKYAGKAKFGARYRPECVGYWVSVARAIRVMPIGCPFEDYKTAFWKWWLTLQPLFRGADATEDGKLRMVQPQAVEEWKKLDGTGPNGVLNVLASLFFWAHPIMKLPNITYREKQTRERELLKWTEAITDVEFAFDGVLALRKLTN